MVAVSENPWGRSRNNMDNSASELIRKAVAGDSEALVELLRIHGPKARRVLAGRIPRCWQSVLHEDDIMQQTYADAAFGIGRFNSTSEGAFVNWLGTTATRNLRDALKMLEADKRGGQERHRVEGTGDQQSYVQLIDMLSSPDRSPSSQGAREEAVEKVKAALQQLPEDYRQAVTMYDLEQLPIAQVAAAMGRSEGAVFMLRARALQRLHEILGQTSDYLTGSS
jgi:RNA polymerase sigma-70 factor (ECF subfamily)